MLTFVWRSWIPIEEEIPCESFRECRWECKPSVFLLGCDKRDCVGTIVFLGFSARRSDFSKVHTFIKNRIHLLLINAKDKNFPTICSE